MYAYNNDNLIISYITNNLVDMMCSSVKILGYQSANIDQLSDRIVYISGSKFPLLNGAFNEVSLHNVLEKSINKIVDFFAQERLPFTYWWLEQSDIPDKIRDKLTSSGFVTSGAYTGIAVKLDNFKVDKPPSEIETFQVSTEPQYKIFIDILATVYQLDEQTKKDFTKILNSYSADGLFKHYIASKDGEFVGILTSYVDKQAVGIYNAATLPQATKHGVCTSLAQHAIKDGMNMGCKFAVAQLMDSNLAANLFQKLGFKEYSRYVPFFLM